MTAEERKGIAIYRLTKSKNTLAEIDLLIKNNLWDTTVIKTGLIEKDLGKFYSRLFDLRQTGDYDDFMDFSKEQVIDLLQPANELITQIESILEY